MITNTTTVGSTAQTSPHQKRLARLRAEHAECSKKIRELQGRELARLSKLEKRKCFIIGEAMTGAAAKDPEINALLAKVLSAQVTDQKKRSLFGLPELHCAQV
ncbi:hypothetical protein M2103_001316 [Ereboglobus sp. PH5-5]|uniref:hypothetical protein n=1 Tax=Ereboglobus sp. PH5-5 TaxID=2940529 RepID=UPI0024049B07|nr:hypothetical protein [Ereboglobus sp. PH5-5]MDF9833099.1 hypothetical protein [Ereboglobus sp. PH5-5]